MYFLKKTNSDLNTQARHLKRILIEERRVGNGDVKGRRGQEVVVKIKKDFTH